MAASSEITWGTHKLSLKESYGSYHMYVSEAADRSGQGLINGVYILKSQLSDPPRRFLKLNLEEV